MKRSSGVLTVAVAVLMTAGFALLTPARETASPEASLAKVKSPAAKKPLKRSCSTIPLADRDVDLIERFADLEMRRLGLRVTDLPPAGVSIGTVHVAFHCVYVDDPFFGTIGLLTQAEIDNQIDLLNTAYDNIDFVLDSTSFTNNASWFYHTPGSNAERQMKVALGSDTSQFLNIYSTGLSQIGLLGYATFPWNYRSAPELDGVVISYDSLPGGVAPYDEGDTAVHEIGHWCGLYHTFQGGCRRRGDGVADTPSEAEPYFGCTLNPPDTCTSAGLDPINNFMDYSDDVCLFEFSAGQVDRMNQMLTLFRPNAIQ